ncbi:MAG: 3-hydroxyacyl-ACP dehydratase FabZ [Verrucomicrobiales bacterium]|nr:3-hydroxyacyl-ACP dehydratase FabZ [Verrucomicrobiales bacterium]
MAEARIYELEELMAVLPHRAPFLFVDRVVSLEPGRQIVAERTLRADEAYFAGHFPGRAIMPGVLVAEALAQTSGLLVGLSEKLSAGATPVQPKAMFLATTQLKFTRPAVPGDTLILKARGDRQFAGLHRFEVEATVGRDLIATGTLTLAEAKMPV